MLTLERIFTPTRACRAQAKTQYIYVARACVPRFPDPSQYLGMLMKFRRVSTFQTIPTATSTTGTATLAEAAGRPATAETATTAATTGTAPSRPKALATIPKAFLTSVAATRPGASAAAASSRRPRSSTHKEAAPPRAREQGRGTRTRNGRLHQTWRAGAGSQTPRRSLALPRSPGRAAGKRWPTSLPLPV